MLSNKQSQTSIRILISLSIINLSICCFLALLSGCKKEIENPPATKINKPDASLEANFTPTNTNLAQVSTYNIINSLPKGYVQNGSVDYTTYLAAAIIKYPNITFPGFPILVNSNGLIIPSNRVLNFLSGSELIMQPNSDGNYNVLRIDHATNVVLNNPVIVGDFGQHIGTTGEWGDGIGVYSSSNITINNPTVSYCWGDGIYLSPTKAGVINTNIVIVNANVSNNRRNGITVSSVIGLDLETPTATYSAGTSPMCGIDFEPQGPTDELQNIVVNNAHTGYNGGNGIQVGYSKLYGGSNKKTSITFNTPYDKKSLVGFKTSASFGRRIGNETITGTLTLNNPFWRQNATCPIIESIYEPNIKMIVVHPAIQNVSGVPLTQQGILSLFGNLHYILVGSNYSLTF
jgi:parallel beta-helix repeat protein